MLRILLCLAWSKAKEFSYRVEVLHFAVWLRMTWPHKNVHMSLFKFKVSFDLFYEWPFGDTMLRFCALYLKVESLHCCPQLVSEMRNKNIDTKVRIICDKSRPAIIFYCLRSCHTQQMKQSSRTLWRYRF